MEGQLSLPGIIPYQILPIDIDTAYLIGVYLGDGSCFRKPRYAMGDGHVFQLGTVDIDFADYVVSVIRTVVPLGRIIQTVGKYHTRPNNQDVHTITVFSKDLFMTMTRLTNNKKRIPKAIWQSGLPIRLRFLEGIFDSEAAVHPARYIRNRYGTLKPYANGDLRIVVTMAERWFKSLQHFVQTCGIRTGKFSRHPQSELTRKPAHTFRVSASDFRRLGGTLHISRKQQALLSEPPQTGREGGIVVPQGTVERIL